MTLETCLIFKIEKKKNDKTFFCGKATVNPLRKKTCAGKTQIALLGHVPGFHSTQENACPMEEGEFTVNFGNFERLLLEPLVLLQVFLLLLLFQVFLLQFFLLQVRPQVLLLLQQQVL
jgi:hypothetical protein